MMDTKHAPGSLFAVIVLLCAAELAQGATIHVDSRIGNNAYDGTSARPLNANVGPVRTLQRAMQLVGRGDALVLTDNGTPYYGSLTFFGPRFSGTEGHPFRVIGNGAVISGAKPIAPESWVELGNNLWRITPLRKGWYQLVENGQALPRFDIPGEGTSLANLPAGSWAVHVGALYYRSAAGENARTHDFELAEEGTGLTLLDVRNLQISNVTFRHFRIDGVNAHDRCAGVTLENVSCLENGRAGVCIGGTCRITLAGGRIAGNARHSLLITELGEATLSETDYDSPPALTR